MNIFKTFFDSSVGYANWLWGQITVESGSLYGNYFWFLGIISAIFFILEVFIPWRKGQSVFRKDFWLDVFYMYFNFFIFYIILLAGLQNIVNELIDNVLLFFDIKNTVAINIQNLNPIWQFLIMFVVQDFTHWNIHRLLHKVPFLWQFHKVHHSVKEMGFAAHLRFHWMESIIYKSITFIPLVFIGFGVDDFFYLHIFTIVWGHYNHTNSNIPLGPLKFIFNSPQMHLWHHAKELPESHPHGMNFGLTLSIWDYIFKTNYQPHDRGDIELGFDHDESYPKGFIGQSINGFQSRKASDVIDVK